MTSATRKMFRPAAPAAVAVGCGGSPGTTSPGQPAMILPCAEACARADRQRGGQGGVGCGWGGRTSLWLWLLRRILPSASCISPTHASMMSWYRWRSTSEPRCDGHAVVSCRVGCTLRRTWKKANCGIAKYDLAGGVRGAWDVAQGGSFFFKAAPVWATALRHTL